MAETPSEEAQSQTQTHPAALDPNSLQYWCYGCNKRVSIETHADLPDVICHECKNGFVEAIGQPPPSPPSLASDLIGEATFGDQFLQVLRLISQGPRDEDAPPNPPSVHADSSDDEYLRIEMDGWDNVEDGDANDLEARNENEDGENQENREVSEDDEEEGDGDEEDIRRRSRDRLRLRLQELASRASNRRNRILDWADILMGLEDHSIALRFELHGGGGGGYIGNPGDYVDAAGYEALLQNLAESDGSGRRGAPPAAKEAIEALDTVVIKAEMDVFACAICKDSINVGEMSKKLPCGHGYHGDCIVPWLGSRNSCPVCRYELPTDDPDYEEEKKKRTTAVAGSSSGVGTGSSSSFQTEFI